MKPARHALAVSACHLLVFLLLITGEHSLAQDDQIAFQRLNPWDIPCPSQVDLVQCRYGFIWILGVELYRYDGLRFEVVRPDSAGDALARSWIRKSMVGGRHGVLLLYGSASEFLLYDIATNRAKAVTLPAPQNHHNQVSKMSCAIEDSEGSFLVGTEEGEIYRLDPKTLQFETVFSDDSRTSGSGRAAIADILEDSSGTIWIGTPSGVLRVPVDLDRSKKYAASSAPLRRVLSGDISGLAPGHDERIWVLTHKGEFGWIDRRTSSYTACPPAIRDRDILLHRPICADLVGDVWVPRGYLGGIMKWDSNRERWNAYLTSDLDMNQRSGVYTTFVYLDRSGNIWVGTNGEGLYRFTRSASKFLSCTGRSGLPSGLSSSNILSVWKDQEGILWVGTFADGLNYLTPGSQAFVQLRHNPDDASSLPSNWISCIRDHGRDEIWVGMVGGGGISVYNKRTGLFARRSERDKKLRNLGADTVTALYQDRAGTMWVGHYTGLDKYDEDGGTFLPVIRWPRETLGGPGTVAYMTEDGAGNLWLATAGRGLGRVNIATGDVTWYLNDPEVHGSLPTDWISYVHYDKTRRVLWVPAQGCGIARYDEHTDSFVTYKLSPSLPASFPFGSKDPSNIPAFPPSGIAADLGGDLWVAAAGKIIKFNPENGTCRWFGHSDGIVVTEVHRNAFFQSGDGTIYVGGAGGLTWFHPDRMPENETIPQVVLTRFAIFGKSVQLPPIGIPQIRLSHREHTFSFEFAALEFTNPAANQFMYKLEGGGGDWTYLGTDRRVTFANVSPGEYLLNVRASNNDGVWNNEGISIPVTITPPYWETYWFRAIVLLALMGAAAAFYRYRLSKVRGMEQLRIRIADDLHDDIGSELSAIALESDLIARRMRSEPEQRQRVHEVGRAVRNAADQLRDVVWIVNPEQEKLTDLVARMREVTRTMLAGIEVSSTIPQNLRAATLSMEFKRNVLLMYKEILNNITRHAKATRVTVLIEETEGILHVRVGDDGMGFDPAASTSGRGLKSIRARAQSIGGTLAVESTPGSGTNVCFKARITHL